ncbi:uncharacterized protein LOC115966761 [Quercus lobata]|uniref:uncharacterized protein LOC115966761 n=1 Tax=Quercus lobata TaxID=97700 RepID=UPI001247DFCD|nr:uncharacterized protein LOC115966761 [Quercus lobata]
MAENGVAIPSNENDAPTSVSDASNSSTFDNEDYISSNEEIVIDEEENEQKLEIEMIEEKKHEINKILDENEIILEPKVGMMFNSEEEVRAYYKQYAKQAGFGVSKRTSKLGHDGNLKYFTNSCVNQQGKK